MPTAQVKARSRSPKIEDSQAVEAKLAAFGETPPLSLAVIDIDEFKQINDAHGHATGDLVLKAVLEELSTEADSGAVLRVGGDAFACLLPATSPEEALLRLDRARTRLEKQRLVGKLKIRIPISIGIASFPHHVEDPSQLWQAAWEALEKAKRDGKNRGTIFVEERMVLKSNYYSRAQLSRLSALAQSLGRTEAALLREALEDLLDKYRDAT
jgi:diguanylate cyclase (GGDEF)-like protein